MLHHQVRSFPLVPEVPENTIQTLSRHLVSSQIYQITYNHKILCNIHKIAWATPMVFPLECHGLPPWSDIQVSWATRMVFHAMGYPHGHSYKCHALPPGSSDK